MTTTPDPGPSTAAPIAAYIRAKDGNRPHLVEGAFTADARLEMSVAAGTLSFPPRVTGRDELAQVLVSRFNQAYENIYTFCLAAPPDGPRASFSCGWLVGMSEKAAGTVRVGFGRYDWSFAPPDFARVDALRITIACMESLPAAVRPDVMAWLAALPYPWCPAGEAAATMPRLEALRAIAGHLQQMNVKETNMPEHRIFTMPFAKVYPLYVQKAERKGRTREEVDRVIRWLTGYDAAGLQRQIETQADFRAFFAGAPAFHPNSALIKGVVCGVRVEEVEDPLMRKIRQLDKLVDELAKGKAMEKILRT